MSHRFLGLLLILLALNLNVVAATEPAEPSALSSLLKNWNAVLDRADKLLTKPEQVPDDLLESLHLELTGFKLEGQVAINNARPEATEIRNELNTLGAEPEKGAPPELPEIASKRKAIGQKLATSEGLITETELAIARAERLLAKLTALRRARFTEKLLTRGHSPLNPEVWRKALPEIALDLEIAQQGFQSWVRGEPFQRQGEGMLRNLSLGLLAALILLWPLRSWLLRRYGFSPRHRLPSHGQRLHAALVTGFIHMLLPSAATLTVYLALNTSGLLPELAQTIVSSALTALLLLYFVAAFCQAALAPFNPTWRIVDLNDHGARVASRIITLIALVFVFDHSLDDLSDLFDASFELTIVHKFISALFITVLLLILLRRKIWTPQPEADDEGKHPPRSTWRRLRYFLGILVLAIPLSAAFGYVALSRMLAMQFVLTAGLYVGVMLLRELIGELLEHVLAPQAALAVRLRHGLGLTEEGCEMLRFWLAEILGGLIILLGIIALLRLWGAGAEEISNWLYAAFFGFKIGNITLSLADILTAGLLFSVLLMFTRLLQRALEQRIFPRTRLDLGLRHSIRSTVGYLGFILAVAVAVSRLGIDLSNLAMIAGALSVGIGFGLQNIVNNFVSGLILLVERPIKVGDWILVGDYQGYVKKISVRATEIGTFDQASVFIPNSNLIASPVTNRTYADKIGRVMLPLGLDHHSDPRRARELMLEIAKTHPEVRRIPAPYCFLKGFGESALNMELVAFVNDVDKVGSVNSDLCFSIDEAFRREGILLAHPQREMHLELNAAQLERLLSALGKPSPNP